MTSDRFAATISDVLAEVLATTDDDVLVVNPAAETISGIVDELRADPELPRVRMLADEHPLKSVMGDFLVASNAADLVAEDRLDIRVLSEVPRSSVAIGDATVTSLVSGGDRVAGLSTDEPPFVDATRDHYASVWDGASGFTLRTPPLSAVRETLAEEIGERTAAEFDAILDSRETIRGDDGIDEVTISILVAARNNQLLYDISKWGEDVGVASKATFSRTKTRLEDVGVIDTEKVPIDVGRPRLRLRIGDNSLMNRSPKALVDSVADRLEGG